MAPATVKKSMTLFLFSVTLMGALRVINKEFSFLSGSKFTFLFMVCMALCIYSLRNLMTDRTLENKYLKFIFVLLCAYELTIIFRGISFGYDPMKDMLQSEYYFWVYIIPFFIFFDKTPTTMAYLVNGIYWIGVAFLILCLVKPGFITNRSSAEAFIHPFAFGCGFVLLNSKYITKKQRIIAFLALFIGTMSFVYLARRNGIISYASLLLFSLILNFKNISAPLFFKIFPIVGGIAVICLLGFDYLPPSFTSKINNRMTEDSRSGVFENLFDDMKDDEAFGKGMTGTYYSPVGGGGPNDDGVEFAFEEYRRLIENGYLQQYLNGGIVYVSLFVLTVLPAVFLGVFKSKNQFTKASAIIIFLWLVDMFIFGLPRLTLEYILVWICVGICYKQSFREMTDDEISDAFINLEEYENTLVY